MKPRSFLLFLLIIGVGATFSIADAADNWSGRRLSEVLDELRAAGLPLIYSNQVVTDALVIRKDPAAILQLQRLKLALQALGLELRSLAPASAGYAIVRSKPVVADAQSAAAAALDEVTVFASRYNLQRSETHNQLAVARTSLEKMAGIEQDVLRSVQYLPGASGNSLSSLTHVRGGYEDENLIRFDGVELHNPVHLKDFQGLFGLLDPDWVQSLDFYSGAFPVQFGNHTAAVIDMTPRVIAQPQISVGASLLYSHLFGGGSYAGDDAHWLVGYRRSNLASVLRQTEKNIGEPNFEDLLLRHSYRLGNGELRAGMLRLHDDLELQTTAQDQQATAYHEDTYWWLGWQHQASESLDYNLLLSHTQLSGRREATLLRTAISSGSVVDHRDADLTNLEAQFNLHNNASTRWQGGVHLGRSRASYDYSRAAHYQSPLSVSFGKASAATQNFSQQFNEPDYASYVSVNHQHGAWRAELGLRYEVFAYLRNGTQLSPRLNLQYSLNSASTLYFSAGRYVQAPTLDQLDPSLDTPRFNPPQRLQQYIAGWTQTLPRHLQLRLEGYQKLGSRLAPHSENLLTVITLASDLEIDRREVNATRSRAQGLELSLTAPAQDHFGWWLNYSRAQVQDQINGEYVRRSWDQPHAVTLGANWTQRRWLFTGSSSWHSGWAYTPLLLSSDQGSAVLSARNSQRFRDFASLELRVQYTRPLYAAQLQLFLELRNALNRENDCCREAVLTDSNGTPRISIENQAGLPLLPLLGFSLKF
jgi:TonB dependent receptor